MTKQEMDDSILKFLDHLDDEPLVNENEKLKDFVKSCIFYTSMSGDKVDVHKSFTYRQAVDLIEEKARQLLEKLEVKNE